MRGGGWKAWEIHYGEGRGGDTHGGIKKIWKRKRVEGRPERRERRGGSEEGKGK